MKNTALGQGPFLYGQCKGKWDVIENTIEQICAYLMENKFHSVRVTNGQDDDEILTSIGFITYCKDPDFITKELLPVLTPMQLGKVCTPKFTPVEVQQNYIVNVRLRADEGFFLGRMLFDDSSPKPYSVQSDFYSSEEHLIRDFPKSISVIEAIEIAIDNNWL